jgi:hypothetical protein
LILEPEAISPVVTPARKPGTQPKMSGRRPESRKWPPFCTILFYEETPEDSAPFEVRHDRDLDLFDAIMLHWGPDERTVFMGLYTDSKQWALWDDKTLRRIERLIRSDLEFDGCEVEIARFSEAGRPCEDEMQWKLVINQSPSPGDGD